MTLNDKTAGAAVIVLDGDGKTPVFQTYEGPIAGGPLQRGDDAKLSSLTCPLEVQDASGEVLGHYLWDSEGKVWSWYPWSTPPQHEHTERAVCGEAAAIQILFETGKEPKRVKPPTAAAAGFETHNGPFFHGPYMSWDTKVLVNKTSPHEVREGDRVLGYYIWDRDHWNWEELKQSPKWGTPADWQKVEQSYKLELEQRITELEAQLSACHPVLEMRSKQAEEYAERVRKADQRVAETERQNADLQASNNQLLLRARAAEDRLLRIVGVASEIGPLKNV